jgi:hypothetical protein
MKFRFARHTNNLQPLLSFYTKIIGLDILGEFNNHSDYNGIFLGFQNQDWHLEFTESDEKVIHAPDEDDLLVFYLEEEEFQQAKSRIKQAGINIKKSKNPYWNKYGIEILDPDGFGVVLTIKQ